MILVTAFAVAALFGAGVHLMTRRDAVRVAAGSLLISNAAVLLLVSAGFGATALPILPVEHVRTVADPLVQALAITAAVISFGITVLLLCVAVAVEQTHGSIDVEDLVAAEVSEDPEAGARGNGG